MTRASSAPNHTKVSTSLNYFTRMLTGIPSMPLPVAQNQPWFWIPTTTYIKVVGMSTGISVSEQTRTSVVLQRYEVPELLHHLHPMVEERF